MPISRHTLGARRAVTNEISASTDENNSSMKRAATPRLPPLSAVQAFEAAARRLSFNRAAEELRVTASAVSHRIRALEDFLGVALFHRLTRQVALTEAGAAYLDAVREGLQCIAEATSKLRDHKRPRCLRVSVAPAFASRLIQQLPDFHRTYPEVEICVIASTRLTDFSQEEVDVAIRHGAGSWSGLASHYLRGDERLPMCSPMLLQDGRRLAHPRDVKHFTLLHALPRVQDWCRWLEQAGVEGVDGERGLKFETSALVLEAVMSGLGIAIVERESAAEALRTGQLLAPFTEALRTETSYYVVYPRRKRKDKTIGLFRDWLLDYFVPVSKPRKRRGPS